MYENNTINNTATASTTIAPEKIKYDDNVIKRIISTATNSIDGVLSLGSNMMENIAGVFSENDNTKGISIKQSDNSIDATVKIVIEFGRNMPEVIAQVESKIRESLMQMAGMEVKSLQVEVTDTMTREEFEAKENKTKKADPVPEQPTE